VNDRIKMLEDALDHIKRIAGMARVPTKRLDWIAARASMALRGDRWDNSYMPYPKNGNAGRARIQELERMVDKLLAHCGDPECHECGEAVCPHGEPLHFHHDGCPACDCPQPSLSTEAPNEQKGSEATNE